VRRRLSSAIVGVAMILLVGCESITLPLPCDLMIVALPADSTLQPGDALPADPQVIAGPGDFDVLRSSIKQALPGGDVSLDLQLRGAAIDRVARHTEDHIGEPMALIINGEIVSVPIIQSPIPDGALSVSPATDDAQAFTERFAGCVR
jgi:preprotein translocase subunit SecD